MMSDGVVSFMKAQVYGINPQGDDMDMVSKVCKCFDKPIAKPTSLIQEVDTRKLVKG